MITQVISNGGMDFVDPEESKYLNNPKLQYLALDECELITGKSVKTLAEKCPLLEHISMDGCYQVRDCKGISGILICQ